LTKGDGRSSSLSSTGFGRAITDTKLEVLVLAQAYSIVLSTSKFGELGEHVVNAHVSTFRQSVLGNSDGGEGTNGEDNS